MGEPKAIDYGNIEIVAPYRIQNLRELTIVNRPNSHTQAYFSGTITAGDKDKFLKNSVTGERIEIYLTDGGQRVRPLFKGLMTEMQLTSVREINYST